MMIQRVASCTPIRKTQSFGRAKYTRSDLPRLKADKARLQAFLMKCLDDPELYDETNEKIDRINDLIAEIERNGSASR